MSADSTHFSHLLVFRRPLVAYLTQLSLILAGAGTQVLLLVHTPHLLWGVGLALSVLAAVCLARGYAAGAVVLTEHEIIVRRGIFFLAEQRLPRAAATSVIRPVASMFDYDQGRLLLTIDGRQHSTPTVTHAGLLVMAMQYGWPSSGSPSRASASCQQPSHEPQHTDQSFARVGKSEALLGPFALTALEAGMRVPQVEAVGAPPPVMTSEQTYDVFLSYHAPDREAATLLHARLREAGLRPWFDRDEITPGQQWMERIEDGLSRSRAIAIVIGPRGLGRWQRHETSVGIRLAAGAAGAIPVIPVLLPGADRHSLPLLLDSFSWVEFRETLEDEETLARLIAGITSARP